MSDNLDPQPEAETGPPAIQLGFARGIAPSKWAHRWKSVTGLPIDLVPVDVAYGRNTAIACDVMLERTLPGARPEGTEGPNPTRHALRLYDESIALIVETGHDLAENEGVALGRAARETLLDHPLHPAEWPFAEPWAEPSWMPQSIPALLKLVATGSGATMLPLLLARHLTNRHDHVVIPLTEAEDLPGTSVWATWDLDRDGADVQQLLGVMRGRTARSSRPGIDSGGTDADRADAKPLSAKAKAKRDRDAQPKSKKPGPKPGSRGAQLAASKKKPPHRRSR